MIVSLQVEVTETQVIHKRPILGVVLSIVSGVLILIQGVLHIFRDQLALELGIGELRRHSLTRNGIVTISIVTAIIGILIIIGAYMVYRGRERMGAITVVAFAVLSIFTGGGYLAGLILGVIGGALVLDHLEKNPKLAKK